MVRPKVYNIVLDSMRRCINDGFSYQTYAFYVAIKMRYKNSTLYNPGVRSVMRLCGCSYSTACKLLSEAKVCRLFKFTETTTKNGKAYALVAVTDKDNFAKITKDGKREYVADKVYKLSNTNEGKSWTLRELVKELQNIAVVYNIGRINADLYQCDHSEAEEHVSYIAQNTIAKFTGLSRETVNMIIKRLAERGVINKSCERCRELYHIEDGQKIELGECEYVDTKRRYVMKGEILCYCVRKEYAARFKHVIWNHCGRIHSRRDQRECKPEVMTEKEKVKHYFRYMHD